MPDRLDEYRRKRDPGRTPEPVPDEPPEKQRGDTFVIQQHHARSLHWDLRLERDGVMVSWAVPRGIPRDPARNHLAVHTEDHPMEYREFHGEIPEGEYGAGRMTIYDHGTYTTEKWRDREVMFVLSGEKVSGRYVLFQTDGKNWMIHRMDPPPPGWTPMPETVGPMLANPGKRLPSDDAAWAYELTWPGARALAHVSGGRLRLVAADDREITPWYRELREMADRLAPTECLLDGVIVAFDANDQISRDALVSRAEVSDPDSTAARRLAARTPAQFLAFDLLWLDGESTVDYPYERRRRMLDALALSGPHWQTPPHFAGGGRHARDTSRAQGLPGVIAKRLTSPYRPGQRSTDWREIPA
jgi:bifunctional non-homologous end joining protein LigD